MTEKRDLLGFYCRKYGMSYLQSQWCWYDYGVENKETFYLVAVSSPITYRGEVSRECLENMSESEIESFVIKCSMECIIK